MQCVSIQCAVRSAVDRMHPPHEESLNHYILAITHWAVLFQHIFLTACSSRLLCLHLHINAVRTPSHVSFKQTSLCHVDSRMPDLEVHRIRAACYHHRLSTALNLIRCLPCPLTLWAVSWSHPSRSPPCHYHSRTRLRLSSRKSAHRYLRAAACDARCRCNQHWRRRAAENSDFGRGMIAQL